MVTEVRLGTQVRLRRKNQLTMPDTVLTEIGAAVGDTFMVSVEDGSVRLERVQRSYAGALSGIYPADWAEQLRTDRDDWKA